MAHSKNSAIGDEALSGAAVLDAPQFGCKPAKVSYFALNLLQVLLRYVIDPGTFFRTLRREVQKLADLVKCEAQVTAPSNESKPPQMLPIKDAIISLRPRRRRHEPQCFVIPDGHHFYGGQP